MTSNDAEQLAAADGNTPPVRTARWVKIALVASLAVNLLVIGAIVGRLTMGPPGFDGGPHEGWSEARRMFTELPRERRSAILGAMRAHRGEFDVHREQIGAARKRTADVIARRDASNDEIRAALDALGRQEAEGVMALRSVIGDVALVMTPEERRMFARRILGREWHGYGPRWAHEDD